MEKDFLKEEEKSEESEESKVSKEEDKEPSVLITGRQDGLRGSTDGWRAYSIFLFCLGILGTERPAHSDSEFGELLCEKGSLTSCTSLYILYFPCPNIVLTTLL